MIENYLCVLADEDCRKLLLILLDRDEPHDIPVPEAVVQDKEGLANRRIEYHHRHLPRLEELGLIDWDQKNDTVTKGSNFERIRPLIEAVDKIERSIEHNR